MQRVHQKKTRNFSFIALLIGFYSPLWSAEPSFLFNYNWRYLQLRGGGGGRPLCCSRLDIISHVCSMVARTSCDIIGVIKVERDGLRGPSHLGLLLGVRLWKPSNRCLGNEQSPRRWPTVRLSLAMDDHEAGPLKPLEYLAGALDGSCCSGDNAAPVAAGTPNWMVEWCYCHPIARSKQR